MARAFTGALKGGSVPNSRTVASAPNSIAAHCPAAACFSAAQRPCSGSLKASTHISAATSPNDSQKPGASTEAGW